jgi:putative DNA primase/helicase
MQSPNGNGSHPSGGNGRPKTPIDFAAVAEAADLRGLVTLDQGDADKYGKWLCPFHDDHHPSLDLMPGDRRYICRACLAQGDALDWIEKKRNVSKVEAAYRLDPSLRPAASTTNGKHPSRELEAFYVYLDAESRPIVKAERWRVDDARGKDFRQLRAILSEEGELIRWEPGTKGIEVPPYQLPELARAERGSLVFIAEGEGKVNAIRAAGFYATCNIGGALKWRDHLSPWLAGMHVIILPDNDEPGRKHAQKVAASVHPVAGLVKVVTLPGLDPKGDIVDWLANGRTMDDVLVLAEDVAVWSPDSVQVAAVAEPDELAAGGNPDADDPPDRQPFPLTDLGNAERMVANFGRKIRHIHPWNKWLYFDRQRWQIDARAMAAKYAQRTARMIYGEAEREGDSDRRAKVAKWAHTSESRARLEAMIWGAARQEGIPMMPEDLDRDPWALNCLNGTLDLRSGQLRNHDPEDFISKIVPIRYDPSAECPLWEQTLRLFLIDPDVIAFWQRLCGYALTGVVRDHMLPIAWGKGQNGKSTILGTLLDVLGPDYAMKCSPEFLMEKKGDSHPTERAALFGKRFVLAIETAEGARINETLIKELTGNDRISARRMREDVWEFNPTHKVFLGTNHKPQVRGTDLAIWRRLKLIPFTYTMPKADAQLDMPERLRAEFPGILAWMVRGCLDWQAHGIAEPESVVVATNQYRDDEDVFGQFISEHCSIGQDYRSRSSVLHAKYTEWAKVSNYYPENAKRFKARLLSEVQGVREVANNGIWFHGIGLKAETSDDLAF